MTPATPAPLNRLRKEWREGRPTFGAIATIPSILYAVPVGVVHDAKVHGDKALKVLGVYVVDKTKPLASPAP